jgi:tetratricopeptide (TPR) repeat protein
MARLQGAIPGLCFLRNVFFTRRLQGVTVSKMFDFSCLLLCAFLVCAAPAQSPDKLKLDRQYQAAVALFDAGRSSEAAAQLELLLPYAPGSFEIHELLGQAYTSLSQDTRGLEHLEEAVRLNPNSTLARTTLATCLLHAGKADLAGEQFKKALDLEPRDFNANHNLGEFYIQSGKTTEALPLLERAQQIRPGSYDNGYDLAMVCYLTGRLNEARQIVQGLVRQKDAGELHNLLAQIEEKDGKYLDAANEFEAAAHMDPSEENLFDWGSELLLHRTYEAAIAVFQEATRRYPNSPRMMIGLGMALDLRGKYDEAVKALLVAADLDPSDARCYLFLSKAYDSSPSQADAVIQRFKRYAELKPTNALAQYYYAMSMWKGKRIEDSDLDLKTIVSLLQRSIALDQTLPEAHVQLGNLLADQHRYEESVPEYVRALELNPNLSDAHYRLGQDYVHVGEKDLAQKEFAIYQQLRAQHLAEVDKERAEVRQFVFSAKAGASSAP